MIQLIDVGERESGEITMDTDEGHASTNETEKRK